MTAITMTIKSKLHNDTLVVNAGKGVSLKKKGLIAKTEDGTWDAVSADREDWNFLRNTLGLEALPAEAPKAAPQKKAKAKAKVVWTKLDSGNWAGEYQGKVALVKRSTEGRNVWSYNVDGVAGHGTYGDVFRTAEGLLKTR